MGWDTIVDYGKKAYDYGTLPGWVGLGINKISGGRVPTTGDAAEWAINSTSGKTGLETAAAGAKEAQAQANALAQLQWQRQMQGLQEARGSTQPYLSLYDKIYGTSMAQAGASRGMPGTMPVGPGLPPDNRAVGPGGVAHPDQKLGPGTVFAPITRGGPPAPGTPPPPPPTQPSGGMSSIPSGDVLMQYLRQFGAFR